MSFQHNGQVDWVSFNRYWNSQRGSDSCRRLYLLYPMVQVHVSDAVLCRMVVWIKFVVEILDLEARWYSLRTEGKLIASAASDEDTRC